ncbi:hypothetical protein AWB81_04800 [Caballeronia arationis]|uniref:Uncharacterized protein n=1 Tax=Caballeronia arationis TaxID=1777142 RepID=A0A7Z7I3J7_9BURK|nr:hypothetical protein AWB81_04800 [Caballeronia arationis]SOE55679.1 hypothetical protein SAMN05446927_1068 [Caballeronia arationis]
MGLRCKLCVRPKHGAFTVTSSCRKNDLPNSRCTCIFELRARQLELTFSDAMHQFDPSDRSYCIPEAFETEHRIDPGLDVAMVLLYQVVQLLRRSQHRLLRQQLVSLHFAHRAMRCRVAIQRDRFRSKPLTLDCLCEKVFGCSDVTSSAEPEIDRFSRSINRAVEVQATTLGSPGTADCACARVCR